MIYAVWYLVCMVLQFREAGKERNAFRWIANIISSMLAA